MDLFNYFLFENLKNMIKKVGGICWLKKICLNQYTVSGHVSFILSKA